MRVSDAKRILFGSLKMASTTPAQFLQQVRTEVSKVVWPNRREVVLTTVMVFIMAALTATVFSLVDIVIRMGLQGILTAF
jgi:preprotein translocase subunit SecE